MRSSLSLFVSSFVGLLLLLLLAVPTATTAAIPTTTTTTRSLQSSNARVVAEAYECDEYLQALPDDQTSAYKPLGYEIRICIRPVTPTRNRGIVMRSLDDFTWFRDQGETVQVALRDGYDRKGTLSVCIPGLVVCSFKTNLLEDFFYGATNGTVTGTGRVTLQFPDDEDNPTFRQRQRRLDHVLSGVVEWVGGSTSTSTSSNGNGNGNDSHNDNDNDSHSRQLQAGSNLGGFAGDSGVKVTFVVDQLDAPDDFVPTVEVDDSTWWEDSPGWLKALVIAGGIIIFLMGLCLCLMCCWTVREYLEDQKDEQRTKELDETEAGQEQAPDVHIHEPVVAGEGGAWDYDGEQGEMDLNDESPQQQQQEQQLAYNGEDSYRMSDLETQPTDKDVCFGGPGDHPGNKAMRHAVKKTLKKYPTVEYAPEQYRHIKKQLSHRRFFVGGGNGTVTVSGGEWREVPKSELVELLRKEFND